ncbi:MAG: LTA synthase family protein [Gemmatimonadaceae bacterium]
MARAFSSATTRRARLTTLTAYGVVLAALTWLISPQLARVSQDRALNEVALNGWYTFTLALLGQDAPYEGLYATRAVDDEARRIRRLVAEPTATAAILDPAIPTSRHIIPSVPEHHRNVVVVLEESLGADFVSALHPRTDTSWTPSYDSLINEGTLLSNAYSTGNRTIRALEATTTSLPPLPGISIVRRSASRNLFTLPALLKEIGYSTSFIYGGRALFDGMGSYMRANEMDRVIEQSDFPKGTFSTAWGVADEFIFDKALSTFDSLAAAKRPFYSLVLSVSNHKPYDYPSGRITADPKARKRTNAVHYADWALGRFIRQAQKHDWFGNTLFVLMGDHGARVYGAAEIPLPSYQVPILFYAPGFIPAGQRIETMASNLDLPPSIMGRLGVPYDSRWFGHDVFTIAPEDGRALMTHNSAIALMRGNRMAELGLKGATDVWSVDRASGKQSRIERPDSADRELIEDAIAYYHSADRMYRAGLYRITRPAPVHATSR